MATRPWLTRFPAVSRQRAQQLSAAARTAAAAAPETLTVVQDRARPTILSIARLGATAIFAYLVAMALPFGTPRPVLAPLTALLVVQVTLYQTVRNAIQRVAAVVAGVLVAIGLSALIGFTWWSLGITIVAALALGYLLRLGDTILEVPISAMLILAVGGTQGAAASGRIIETAVGAGTGLLAGVILAKPRVETAHDAIEGVCQTLAGLLDQMADGLCDGSAPDSVSAWLDRSRSLGGEIRRLDDAVRQAEESVVLNPRGLRRPAERISLRDSLETLERATITVRGLARSLADLAQLGDDHSSMREPDQRTRIAGVLRELSAAVTDYGRIATSHDVAGREGAERELRGHLDAARDKQDQLSVVLAADPVQRPVGWPLRGELVSHVDRLRHDLEPGPVSPARRDPIRSWRLPAPVERLQPRLQAWGRRSLELARRASAAAAPAEGTGDGARRDQPDGHSPAAGLRAPGEAGPAA